MDNKQIIEQLVNVINALNNVQVMGAQNCLNIGGSVNILTGLVQELQKEAVQPAE